MADQSSSSSAKESGKTLPKASLYAPLAAYSHEDPALFVRTKKPSTSTQESSLFDFLGKVSHDYHRNGSLATSKNSANRPSAVNELKDKLHQRALTLVTGGINPSKKQGLAVKNATSAANRRRRKRKVLIACNRKDEVKGMNALSSEMKQRQSKFLQQLNFQWNNHVRRLVRCQNDDGTILEADVLSKRVFIVAKHIEWIGAQVLVQECLSHPAWVGRQGILVSSTTQTWKIIVTKCMDDQTVRFNVLAIPKKASLLTVEFSFANGTDNSITDARIYIQLRDGIVK